jgi:RimJ/RimL family protein N-acetyltransferase
MIETKRITLKVLEQSDAGSVLGLLSDPVINKYVMQTFSTLTINNVLQHLMASKPGTQCLPFGIYENESGAFQGIIIVNDIHPINRSACFRYLIVKSDVLRKRYGGEAAYKVANVLFNEMNIRRLHACSVAGNEAIEQVFVRSGFRVEGVAKKEMFLNGSWVDKKYWAVLKKEFKWDVKKEFDWENKTGE